MELICCYCRMGNEIQLCKGGPGGLDSCAVEAPCRGGDWFVSLTLSPYFFFYLGLLACGLACPVTHLLSSQALKSGVNQHPRIILKISRGSAQNGTFIISRLVLNIHKVMAVQKMRAVKTQKARANKILHCILSARTRSLFLCGRESLEIRPGRY